MGSWWCGSMCSCPFVCLFFPEHFKVGVNMLSLNTWLTCDYFTPAILYSLLHDFSLLRHLFWCNGSYKLLLSHRSPFPSFFCSMRKWWIWGNPLCAQWVSDYFGHLSHLAVAVLPRPHRLGEWGGVWSVHIQLSMWWTCCAGRWRCFQKGMRLHEYVGNHIINVTDHISIPFPLLFSTVGGGVVLQYRWHRDTFRSLLFVNYSSSCFALFRCGISLIVFVYNRRSKRKNQLYVSFVGISWESPKVSYFRHLKEVFRFYPLELFFRNFETLGQSKKILIEKHKFQVRILSIWKFWWEK